jgi:hypothetical protein
MDVASFGIIYNGIGLQIAVVVRRAAPTDAVYKAANVLGLGKAFAVCSRVRMQ